MRRIASLGSFIVLALCAVSPACGDDSSDPTPDGAVTPPTPPTPPGTPPTPPGTPPTPPGTPPTPPPTDGGGPPGSDACVPRIEICGDRMDQNCDGRDQSCGDNDTDRFNACREGDDLTTCDCDDTQSSVYPGHPEECDGRDNDCDGRVDEVASCCAGCMGVSPGAADVCLEDGSCDCSTAEGVGPCPTGSACCSRGCTDLSTDVTHCGFCELACGNTADRCTGGMCMCGTGPQCDFITMCSGGSCG